MGVGRASEPFEPTLFSVVYERGDGTAAYFVGRRIDGCPPTMCMYQTAEGVIEIRKACVISSVPASRDEIADFLRHQQHVARLRPE
jgi:hypothetical protein